MMVGPGVPALRFASAGMTRCSLGYPKWIWLDSVDCI